MNRFFTVCIASLVALIVIIPHATAADYVEGTIRDAAGKEIYSGQIYESDIPSLVQFVKEGSYEADQAKEILIRFGPKAVPALLDALKDGKGVEGVFSVLIHVVDERALEVATTYVSDPSPVIREYTAVMLVKIGPPAVPAMLDLLGKKETNETAVNMLVNVQHSPKSLELVRAECKSPNPLSRAGAAYLLGLYRDTESEQAVMSLLDDPDPVVRAKAMEGYGNLFSDRPDRYDVDVLLQHLDDTDPSVRFRAVEILGRVDDDRAVRRLMGMLDTEKDHRALGMAVEVLGSKDVQSAVFPILKLLDHEDTDYRFQTTVIYVLGQLKAKEAVPYLVEPFKSGKPVNLLIQKDTFKALVKIGEPVELGMFLKYIQPGDPHKNSTNHVLALIDAFAKPGDKGVVDALKAYRPDATRAQGEVIDRTLRRIE